jgi:hypothetical protein
MTNILGVFNDYADAPETYNNYADDIVLCATVRNVVAQAAGHPAFLHPICNTYIHNSEICVIMINFSKTITFCAPGKEYFVLFKVSCHAY